MNTVIHFRSLLVRAAILCSVVAVITVASPSVSIAGGGEHGRGDSNDFGMMVEELLIHKSEKLFGIERPLDESAPETESPYRTEDQDAGDQVLLADGLKAEYVSREVGNKTDMMAFYPADDPSYLITCVEGGREEIVPGKYNPSVQRINLMTGSMETVLRGMNRCDGIRATAWGTILVTEETTDGGAYEILLPITTTEQTVLDRSTGDVTDPAHIAKRDSLPTMAWEGLTVLPSGVVIGGDELRPGSDGPDTDGGAIFKFIPDAPHAGGDINSLTESPLAAGSVHAMQISCRESTSGSFPQYGQGCEVGQGTWVTVNAATVRHDADANGATGYYRPEDLHRDLMFNDADNPAAIRFCWTNTGREKAENYAEVMCAVDYDPLNSGSLVVANRFIEGDADFNSFDNLAFQPVTGNLYVIEDHDNGDIFACLPDGADRNIKSDGCVKVISVKDSSAEPTGFIFTKDGSTAYLSIQHSDDDLMPLYDDYPTDDLLKITGFKVKSDNGGHGWHKDD